MQPMLAEFKRTLASIALLAAAHRPRFERYGPADRRRGGERGVLERSRPRAGSVRNRRCNRWPTAGCDVFLEIGPHPTLLGMARQCVSDDAHRVVTVAAKRQGRLGTDAREPRGALCPRRRHRLAGFDFAHRRLRVTLPGYPFHRERFWVSSPAVTSDAEMPAPPQLHPLLGREVLQSISTARLFESRFDLRGLPYLEDHRIHGSMLLPPPAFMEMSLAAAAQQFGAGSIAARGIHRSSSAAAGRRRARPVQIALDAPIHGECKIRISSRGNSERRWILHATGRMVSGAAPPRKRTWMRYASRITGTVDVSAYYGWLSSLGLEFGPRFRAVESIARRDGEVLARMQVRADDRGRAGKLSCCIRRCSTPACT